MNIKILKIILIIILINVGNINFAKICNSTDINHIKIIRSFGWNDLETYNLSTKKTTNLIELSKDYHIYDFDIIDGVDIYLSFSKMTENDEYYGIAYYDLKNGNFKEIYKTKKEQVSFYPVKIEKSNLLYFIEDNGESSNIIKYNIDSNKKEEKNINGVLGISICYFTNQIIAHKSNETLILDENFNTVLKFDSYLDYVYNPKEKRFYIFKGGSELLRISEEKDGFDKVIKLKRSGSRINKIIKFDKTGRYLFFEGYGFNGYKFIGIFDFDKNGKMLKNKPTIVDNRYKIISE